MARLALLTPLRERDFALLSAGMTASMLADGIFLVAMAWQVYDLSESTSSLSLVSLAWSLGMVGCLLLGGLASDRLERRRLMIAADVARLVAVGVMGTLAITGHLRLYEIAILAFTYGCAEAFFGPAFGALIPQLVPAEVLVQANALQETVRPITQRLAGPAIGGVLVAAFGAGSTLLVAGGAFVASATCIAFISPRPGVSEKSGLSMRADLKEGIAFVRAHTWLWGTLLMASVSILAFWGPVEVLLPYLIRHELDRPASDFGLVLAASGVGGVLGAMTMSRGLPRRRMRALCLVWGYGLLPISAYSLANATWQLAVLAVVFGFAMSVGAVIWSMLMQTRVPTEMLGRVTALDWFVSIGLLPISFALVGPISNAVGARATLAGAGIVGAAATLGMFYGIGDMRRDDEIWADDAPVAHMSPATSSANPG